jgi:hypothetical protein
MGSGFIGSEFRVDTQSEPLLLYTSPDRFAETCKYNYLSILCPIKLICGQVSFTKNRFDIRNYEARNPEPLNGSVNL